MTKLAAVESTHSGDILFVHRPFSSDEAPVFNLKRNRLWMWWRLHCEIANVADCTARLQMYVQVCICTHKGYGTCVWCGTFEIMKQLCGNKDLKNKRLRLKNGIPVFSTSVKAGDPKGVKDIYSGPLAAPGCSAPVDSAFGDCLCFLCQQSITDQRNRLLNDLYATLLWHNEKEHDNCVRRNDSPVQCCTCCIKRNDSPLCLFCGVISTRLSLYLLRLTSLAGSFSSPPSLRCSTHISINDSQQFFHTNVLVLQYQYEHRVFFIISRSASWESLSSYKFRLLGIATKTLIIFKKIVANSAKMFVIKYVPVNVAAEVNIPL